MKTTTLCLAFLILAFSPAHAVPAPQPIYLFPIQFEGGQVAKQERDWLNEVYAEEIRALFWLKPITVDEAKEEMGNAGSRLAACKTPRAALDILKSRSIPRMIAISVSSPKRKLLNVRASVFDTSGRTVYEITREERGGEAELKYALPGILEELFAQEIAKNSKHISSIVETGAVTGTDADRALDRGDELLEEGRIDEAVAQFEQAVDASPGLSLLWTRLARAKNRKGDFSGAMQAASKALELEADDASALLARAEASVGLGDYGAARKSLGDVLSADQRNAKAHYLNGLLDRAERKLDTALTNFSRAVELSPNQPEARMQLGVALLAQKRRDEAEVHLGEALRLGGVVLGHPDLLDALFELGTLAAKEGRGLEARKWLEPYYQYEKRPERSREREQAKALLQ